MATKVGGKASRWVPIPDGEILLVKVFDVALVEKEMFKRGGEQGEKETRDRVEFTFKVIEGNENPEFVGKKIRSDTPTTWVNDEKCKLHKWAERILGEKIDADADEEFDLDVLKGKTCRIVMAAKEKPRRDGEGIWTDNWVDDVLPDRATMRQQASAATDASRWGGDEQEPF